VSGERILVVDDEPKMRRVLEIMLRGLGYTLVTAGDGREALERQQRQAADLILTDLRMPRMDGLALLRALRAQGDEVPVIVITAYGTVETAVNAMKEGASDYILRPFEMDAVELAVERALALDRVRRENRYLRRALEGRDHGLLGQSAPMQALRRLIAQIGPSGSPVLICGETGTGKELVAKALHQASGRTGLLVPVNCAALPADLMESELFGHERGAFTGAVKGHRGRFEMADQGTLFLDEVTEMPVGLQAKLLRALQEGVVERLGGDRPIALDLRVVAATNRDPGEAVAQGRLRQDLLYRLDVLRIDLPPLRERKGDIALLAETFLGQRLPADAARERWRPGVLDLLAAYPWPGNVRELQNVVERALVLSGGGPIGPEHLPREIVGAEKPADPPAPGQTAPASLALPAALEALERRYIQAALERTQGNKAAAARLLQISERSLWYKIKKFARSPAPG